MKAFVKKLYIDGGPNDKGKVLEYRLLRNRDKPPVNHNNFEVWEKISVEEYFQAKKEAEKELSKFKIGT